MNIHKNLTPNQARLAYDSVAAILSAIGTWTFLWFFFGQAPNLVLLCTPFLLAVFNWPLGIFSRFSVGSGFIKAPILTASVVGSAVILALVGVEIVACVLWSALVWAPLVLPRIFLNLNSRDRASFMLSAVRKRGPVLVVGGGGYIGTHVVDQLLSLGYQVRVLDRFVYGTSSLAEFFKDRRLEIIEGDVTDITKLTLAMTGASAVVHLAGLVGDPACAVDETFTRHTNIIATRMLKEVAISLGVPRFIFASSCSVYGASETEVDETSKLNPVSLYAKTKIDSEKELLSYVDQAFCVTVLRFATVFGHSRRQRFDLVGNLFTAQAFVDGRITVTGEDQWRPFVHVKDLAIAIVRVLRAREDRVNREIFNVGDSRLNLTIGQLAEVVKAVVSQEHPVEIVKNVDPSDKRNYMASFKKIRRVLGFECSVTMVQGIEEMLAKFKNGTYQHYRNPLYSNLEMTKRELTNFNDPLQSGRLYSPLTDVASGTSKAINA